MINREEALLKLKEIIRPYSQNQAALADMTEATSFITDLQINSANLVDVILDVEEQFAIVIDNDSMEMMLDAGTAISIIETKLAEK